MAIAKSPEYWLRGPVDHVPSLLQPVAHALLQAREEVNEVMLGFSEKFLWEKPVGLASPGFHLQHLKGVLDRLFTYAHGRMLSEEQLQHLKLEGSPVSGLEKLLSSFSAQVDQAIEDLKSIDENILTETRFVGRAQVPSTTMGLLFHAAEHTMRHLGQLIVTVKVLGAGPDSNPIHKP